MVCAVTLGQGHDDACDCSVRDLSLIQEPVITYHWTILLEEKKRLVNVLIISYSVCFSNATDTSILLLNREKQRNYHIPVDRE